MDFTLYWYDYLRILTTISAIFTIPGWALISINHFWKRWTALQRWIIAIGLSIAFYPVLFYTSRTILPDLQIGPIKTLIILLLGLIWIAWKLGSDWKTQFQFMVSLVSTAPK